MPRLRTHNQKLTVAAMQMALKNVCAQRSYQMAMRRQSFSLPNRPLNEVTALVKLRAVDDGLFTVGAARNAGLDATFGKGLAQPVAVITLVGYQDSGFR